MGVFMFMREDKDDDFDEKEEDALGSSLLCLGLFFMFLSVKWLRIFISSSAPLLTRPSSRDEENS